MTAIVGMALGTRDIPTETPAKESTTANFLLPGSVGDSPGLRPAPAVGIILSGAGDGNILETFLFCFSMELLQLFEMSGGRQASPGGRED